jgi:hypothetical protein
VENKKIYNLKQIEVACVIGSPIVAGILIAHNYRVWDKRQKATNWIIIGIIWTIALFAVAMMIPEGILDKTRALIPALNGLILYPIIKRLQGAQIDDHFRHDGERASNWIIAGYTILITLIIIIPIIFFSKISPINDYERLAFNSDGVYYNSSMPIKEVNKLGGILQRIGYFNQKSPSEVVFLSRDTLYDFKLVTEKSNFDNKEYLSSIQQIFKHVASYDFIRPIVFKITDPYLKHDKIINLANYDSIPILLEFEIFAKNINFKMIFDKSMEISERERFQRLILDMGNIFPPQKRFDFLINFEGEKYKLGLFIPKQNWTHSQLINEAKFFKNRLNNFGFKYPFRLVLLDETGMKVEEKEIE